MAKKQKKDPSDLMQYDFLPQVNQPAGGGLYKQLAQLGQVQRSEPLQQIVNTQALITPLTTMLDAANQKMIDGMADYNKANPDLDESQMFEGTEDLVAENIQSNTTKFKELNRKLAYMNPGSKKYSETVSEINDLSKNNINLRDDNKKLLAIRNIIKESDIQELSGSNAPELALMYSNIQQGVKDNFKNIDGKLHWVHPNDKDVEPIAVSSISADGPEMTNGKAFVQANKMMMSVAQTPASQLNTQNLNFQVGTVMFKEIGNDGVKSLIFDGMNPANTPYSKNGAMFNTTEWWNGYVKSMGIEPNSAKAIDLMNDIKRKGVLHTPEGGSRVLEHFQAWYVDKLQKVKKTGKGVLDDTDEEENSNLPFKPTAAYGAYEAGSIRLTGDGLNKLSDDLLSGSLNTKNGTFNVDLKTNIWTNDKTGKTMSGDQVLEGMQQSLDNNFPNSGYKLKAHTHWQQFRGTEGGKGNDSDSTYNSEDITATIKGSNNDRQVMNKLKNKYSDKFDFDVDITDGEYVRVKLKGVDGVYKSIFVDSKFSENLAEYMNKVVLLNPAS